MIFFLFEFLMACVLLDNFNNTTCGCCLCLVIDRDKDTGQDKIRYASNAIAGYNQALKANKLNIP